MATSRSIVVLAVGSALVVLLTGSAGSAPHAAPGNPDPNLFRHPGTNGFFPLTPGLMTRLHGTDEGERYRETPGRRTPPGWSSPEERRTAALAS